MGVGVDNRILFSLLVSGNSCVGGGGGKAVMEGYRVVIGGIPH